MASKKANFKKQLVAYSFIAPNFIGFAIFTLVPIVFAVVLAFLHWDGSNPMEWAGLANFSELLDDDQFKAALKNTIVYTAGTVPLTLLASLFLAVILNQGIKARNFFRTVIFFPYIASLVAVAAVWNMIFNPSKGPVNMLLYALGFENVPGWAADKDWAMITIILFSVWKYMGYYMIIYLAGLQGINPELYEAANLDGTNAWQRFRYVTVPQLSATTFFILVMLTIQCFKVYDIVYMVTQAGPGTATLVLVYDIYNKAFISWNLGSASAVAMVLFALVLAVTLIQFSSEKRMH
ncbi:MULTISPECIES: carbohydrate ABC transporter permease [unclassified Sphaerochaeta]|jgi:multiple sugar transport system permease protein|uniref:carbohydrate ABC transporter permease n=1 Tax=unclassified Sphaerochaeta TaxID=2637943 RepID=UPI000B24A358|nr:MULTISPECIES: sugar ABC transporter permease [unclassified Sphaerochaeta]MCK9600370.1 sugar ABC transporter permease [Sphaerochaeta sp.]MDX9823946.1 sugar ABC transporter permease [Sphaerochaeta sp.]